MPQDTTSQLFDVPGFCAANRISRALFYKLLNDGDGPRVMKVGRRTLVSPEAAAEWRQRMERQSAKNQQVAA